MSRTRGLGLELGRGFVIGVYGGVKANVWAGIVLEADNDKDLSAGSPYLVLNSTSSQCSSLTNFLTLANVFSLQIAAHNVLLETQRHISYAYLDNSTRRLCEEDKLVH